MQIRVRELSLFPRQKGGQNLEPNVLLVSVAIVAPLNHADLVTQPLNEARLTLLRGVPCACIRPGKPVENTYIESFHGRLQDECVNVHQISSLTDAQHIIEAWRLDDNQRRLHSSLGHLTPNEFLGQCQVSRTAEDVFCSR
jgi:transposase InsO family protein